MRILLFLYAPSSVRFTTLDGEPRAIQRYALALPAPAAIVIHAIAECELVARRAGELEAIDMQTKARAAANSPWVAESVKELRALAARKDEVMFSKKSAFAGRGG